MSRFACLAFLCAILHAGDDGREVRIIQEQVAGVETMPHVGSNATAVFTLAGTFYVRETPPQAFAALAAANTKQCE